MNCTLQNRGGIVELNLSAKGEIPQPYQWTRLSEPYCLAGEDGSRGRSHRCATQTQRRRQLGNCGQISGLPNTRRNVLETSWASIDVHGLWVHKSYNRFESRISQVLPMAKYGYFLVIPVDPSRMNKIFKDCRVDKERIDAIIKYVTPIIREIWKEDKKLPIMQTRLTDTNRKWEVEPRL